MTAYTGTTYGAPSRTARMMAARGDDWPYTRRPLPWLLAAFLTMVFLIPFDGINFHFHLPVDSHPDRFLLIAAVAVLVAHRLGKGSGENEHGRLTAVGVAILVFTGLAFASVALNVDRIYSLSELTLAEKRLLQLAAYVVFFLFVIKTVRATEVRAFGRLVIALACITSLGVLYEAHTGYNVFFEWSRKLLHPFATIAEPVTVLHPTVAQGRKAFVGPTAHPLALAAMLSMAMPFAVIRAVQVKELGKRMLYIAAIGLIVAAALSTARKTAIIAPIGAMLVLVVYDRKLLKLAPMALILLVPAIHFASPGALGTFGVLFHAGSETSTQGRTSDYSAIAPDVATHPVLGRGFGTLDPDNARWYRILDNEYLGELYQVGVLGLLGYLGMVLAALAVAHRVIRSHDPLRAPPVIAAAAGCAAFGVVSATFDAMSFPQAPYMFFFVAGLIAAAAGGKVAEAEATAEAELQHSRPVRLAPVVTA